MMTSTTYEKIYTLDMLRNEARELIDEGCVNCQQPIYTLCRYIPEREWECIKLNLEDNEFLMRDRIIDLLSHERWDED
ncbi:MAG: DUF4327 family protein [Phormidesmis sp. RL_2_1]|nr:DUF4327 family protein [Phormidesmis sp. RL_2_1]